MKKVEHVLSAYNAFVYVYVLQKKKDSIVLWHFRYVCNKVKTTKA